MTEPIASSKCPVCGVDTPHVHNLIEQGQYTKIQRLNAALISTQAREAMLVEAGSMAMNLDYFREHNALATAMREALSNSAEHTTKFMAEVRMKAYADVLEDAIDICQNQQGNEESDDFAQGFEAGCKECEEGIKHLANELRSIK